MGVGGGEGVGGVVFSGDRGGGDKERLEHHVRIGTMSNLCSTVLNNMLYGHT